MKPMHIVYVSLCCTIMNFLPSAYAADTGWQLIDSYEGVDLYRAQEIREGLLPFKAAAELDIPFQQIVMALVDTEQKQQWAPKLKSTIIHNQLSANRFEYSEYYTTPWPFEDREFLLTGTVTYGKDRILFSGENSENTMLADDEHTLANVEVLEFAIIPLSERRSRVEFTFSGDMGGWIPDFVKTIIQKKWPVRFIQALEAYINGNPSLDTPRYQALEKSEMTFSNRQSTPSQKKYL